MAINRRAILKTFALAPILSVLNSRLGYSAVSAVTSADDPSYVNINVHGLFFMRFSSGKLELIAPDIDEHKYCTVSGGFLTEMPPQKPLDINFTDPNSLSGLMPGKITSFTDTPAIPQFSVPKTNVGDLSGSYRVKITLPQPEEIIPLRRVKIDDFESATQRGNVRDNILASCRTNKNTHMALVTCLRYQKEETSAHASPTVVTYNFYAEHIHIPTATQTNQVLRTAAKIFTQPGNFDLNVTKIVFSRASIDIHPGYGVSPDDEKSLLEILPSSITQRAHALCCGDPGGSCAQYALNPQ